VKRFLSPDAGQAASSAAGAVGATTGWHIDGAPFLIAAALVAAALVAGLLRTPTHTIAART